MAYTGGPWWSNTTWGRRKDLLSVTLTVALLAFMLWKAIFP